MERSNVFNPYDLQATVELVQESDEIEDLDIQMCVRFSRLLDKLCERIQTSVKKGKRDDIKKYQSKAKNYFDCFSQITKKPYREILYKLYEDFFKYSNRF